MKKYEFYNEMPIFFYFRLHPPIPWPDGLAAAQSAGGIWFLKCPFHRGDFTQRREDTQAENKQMYTIVTKMMSKHKPGWRGRASAAAGTGTSLDGGPQEPFRQGEGGGPEIAGQLPCAHRGHRFHAENVRMCQGTETSWVCPRTARGASGSEVWWGAGQRRRQGWRIGCDLIVWELVGGVKFVCRKFITAHRNYIDIAPVLSNFIKPQPVDKALSLLFWFEIPSSTNSELPSLVSWASSHTFLSRFFSPTRKNVLVDIFLRGKNFSAQLLTSLGMIIVTESILVQYQVIDTCVYVYVRVLYMHIPTAFVSRTLILWN